MAYSELIKDFRRIREYLHDFSVYGFKVRGEFTQKSARSYDNERRRVESWMGDYLSFSQDGRGKRVALSQDSRNIPRNPLYRAFKAKSFTSKDILLHFCLMDLFASHGEIEMPQILPMLEKAYPDAIGSLVMDQKTLRLKVRELASMGLLESSRSGRKISYRMAEDAMALEPLADAIDFYSEILPLGVVGSYLLDKLEAKDSAFRYKHHYPMYAVDSEILAGLLEAMDGRRAVEMTIQSPAFGELRRRNVPLKIYSSTENGREYVLLWSCEEQNYFFTRLDRIREVRLLEPEADWQQLRQRFRELEKHLWGISFGPEKEKPVVHWLEMEILYGEGESYIPERVQREKRCAEVTIPEAGRCLVRAEVFDPMEMMPWIFSFTGRIARLESSDPRVNARYAQYLEGLEAQYG